MSDHTTGKLLFVSSFIVSSFISLASQAAEMKIYLNTGTGFMVNRDGYIVTNLHVVNYCERITVTGEMNERDARLVARDSNNDLALLKINIMGAEAGQFSSLRNPLKEDDRVIIVGYPGEAARTGETVTRETQIQSTRGPQGEAKWLQLGDVIEQGNSGGPLLDNSGNIVGVVSARVMTYTYNRGMPQNGVTRQFGVAVATPVVEDFLRRNNVRYQTSDADTYLSADRISDNARRFIVNVRCAYKTELR